MSTTLPAHDPATLDGMHKDFEKRNRIYIPPVVAADGDVIDGKARLDYAKEHGIEIPEPILVGNLSAMEKADLRNALNVHRRHLTREQWRQLIAHELAVDSGRSNRSIAAKLGVSKTTVGAVREQTGQVAQLRRGADGKMHPARKPVLYSQTPAQTREAMKVMQAMGERVPDGPGLTPRKLRQAYSQHKRDLHISEAKVARPVNTMIHTGDFRKLDFADASVDLFICDPPWKLWREYGQALGETMKRMLKPGGFAAIYTGSHNVHDWSHEISKSGLHFRVQVAAVHSHRGTAMVADGSILNLYTPIQVFSRDGGIFRPIHTLSDVLMRGGIQKDAHPWQQPVSDSVELIRCLSRPGAVIADLFVCSGTVAVATHRSGNGRSFVGCEIDRKLAKYARWRVVQEQRSGKGA